MTGHPVARLAARRLITGSVFACESLEARRLFAAGDLDTSFGGDGDVSISAPGGSLVGRNVAVQADGKTVVVGYVDSADGFAVTRYNLNGTPDTAFGPDHNGTVINRFSSSSADDVAIQPDGKIVVLGSSDLFDTRVIRYNPDGALDRTFGGGDGSVAFDPVGLSESADMQQLILLPDGKILLGGDALTGIFDSDFDLAFIRLNADGSFDDSFDGDGKKFLGFGTNERFGAMAIDYSGVPATNPDYGKIVVAGYRFGEDANLSSLLVTRLFANGAHDGAYDGDGSGQVRFPGSSTNVPSGVLIQDDGRIVVGATLNGNDFMLARFLHHGPLDTSFGADQTGWARINMGALDIATDLMAAPSGALILAGYSQIPVLGGTKQVDAIAYYTPNGLPDTRFGGDGKIVYNTIGGRKLAAGPGRRFVFAGGAGMHATRILDLGANVVYAATLNSVASETGPTSRGFFLYRVERVPYATRVYFSVSGTATAPTARAVDGRTYDYVTEGMVFRNPITGANITPYAVIPANETFTVVTMRPIDDREVEGNETALFTIRPDAAYEVGDPASVRLIIVDNDAPPPTVTEVFVRGSAWKGTDGDALNVTFKEYLASTGVGNAEFGYRVDNLAAATTLPWTNVNEVVLRYSAPPTGSGIPIAGGVTLDGVRSDYAVMSVSSLDAQTFLLTLDRPLGMLPPAAGGGIDGDRVRMTVAGGGPNGSAYALVLNTLQGDADRISGRVSALDLSHVRSRLTRNATQPSPGGVVPYTPFADVNADSRINVLDLVAVRARQNDILPGITTLTSARVLFSERQTALSVLSPPEAVLG